MFSNFESKLNFEVAGDTKNYRSVMYLIEEQKLKVHLQQINIWVILYYRSVGIEIPMSLLLKNNCLALSKIRVFTLKILT
jgi:hypothetical protein